MDVNHRHYTEEQWHVYAVGAEMDRESMDGHLNECERCIELFMQVIEANSDQLPKLSDTSQFSADIADHIKVRAKTNPSRVTLRTISRYKWFMKPAIQYTIAASLTILLVGTGAFQQLIHSLSQLSSEAEQGTKTVISIQLTEKADRLLDSIPAKYPKKKEGLQ
jgi:translation initiation factor 2B subunit (eIF-2B alpha/beta/delta family)